jgi:hypothetical protein
MIKLTQAEAKKKRYNPWYCKECRKLVYISYGYLYDLETDNDLEIPYCPICHSYNVVEKPQYETPEEFNDRTGRPWKDDSAVYMWVDGDEWRMRTYRDAKFEAGCCRTDNVPYKIYCANSDTGIPGKDVENA